MKCEKERIQRKKVNKNVRAHYDPDREFFSSFFKAYLIEAVLEFFGMENRNSRPTRHVPPTFNTKEEEKEWVSITLGKFIDTMIFPAWSNASAPQEAKCKVLLGFYNPSCQQHNFAWPCPSFFWYDTKKKKRRMINFHNHKWNPTRYSKLIRS